MSGRDGEHGGRAAGPCEDGARGGVVGEGVDGFGDRVLVELSASGLLAALHADIEPPAVVIELPPPGVRRG